MTQQEQDANKGPAPSVQHDVQQAISDQMNALSGALEGGLSAASDALRSGTAAASHEAAQAASTAKAWYASTAGYLKTADETVIGTLKRERRRRQCATCLLADPALRSPQPLPTSR